MKNLIFFVSILCGSLIFCHDVRAQGATPGCKVIDAHCVCKNPHKDFKIENHPWKKANPSTEAGDCRSKLAIDEAFKKTPTLLCMNDKPASQDPKSPQTECKATWTCKESCWVD